MTREVYVPYGTTGSLDLYFRRRNAAGLYWRGDTSVYEAYNAANIALYGADAGSGVPYNAITEDGATGDYFGDDPTSGAGTWTAYEQVGAAPLASDVAVATGEFLQAAAAAAITAVNLDHVAGTATGIPALPAGTYLADILEDTGTTLPTAIAAVPTAGEIDTQLSGTHGAGAWGINAGVGTGTRAVAFTVTTGGVALLGASVRLYRTGSIDRTGTTNASGQVTLYCDVDATWSYAVTHALYDSGSGTVVVDGNETVPVSLTAVTWPASTVPGTTTVRWRVRKANRDYASDAECTVYMGISKGPGVAGTIYNGDNLDYDSDATDADGYVYFANTPKGAIVAVKTATDGQTQFVKIPADCGSTFEGLELIGSS